MEMMNWGLDTLENLYPVEERDSSEYWEYNADEEEWYFLDPRNGQWYAESMLTPNRWCLVERLYDYEYFEQGGYIASKDTLQEEMEFDYAS